VSVASALSTKPERVVRFSVIQRLTHWCVAILFGVLMFTAVPLYFGSFFGVVFERHVIAQIHLWCGLVLPIPVIASLLGPWGAPMRRDLRRVNYWTRAELRWIKYVGRRALETDKYNPGQKLNTIFTGSSILVMLATGALLQWFRLFPVSWREGATSVHDAFAYALFAVIGGHVALALTHRDALRSMFSGTVSMKWARSHTPGWAREEGLDGVENS